MSQKIKNILFFVTVALLCVPITLHYAFENHQFKPLNGVYDKTDTLEISWEFWRTKKWQENKELILKDNLKYIPSAVRIQHDFDYSIFGAFHMRDLLIGKDEYMFSSSWAKARCCKNYLDQDSLNLFVKKLKVLQDLATKKGKYCIFIIPPSKEEIFTDKLPNKYAKENPNNDYHLYLNALNKHKVKYWDLLDYYQQLNDTSQYPVYSKTSTHWTKYGAHFTMLNLIEQMELKLGINMPNPKVVNLEVSKFKGEDGDHETTLNLSSRSDTIDFAYPIYKIDSTGGAIIKPKVITIGDSFYWAIKGSWQLQFVYSSSSKYLYYYSTVYHNSNVGSQSISELNIVEEFKSSDAIVFINSTHNFKDYPFGLEKDIDKIIEGLKSLPDHK